MGPTRIRFIWTEGNRPAVIGSIWSVKNRKDPQLRHVAYEFHSLLPEHVIANQEEEVVWHAKEAGLDWHEVEGPGLPAASRELRLSQMRRLLRRVSATTTQSGESELRLLGRPLYRYAEEVEGVIDGAVFGLVMGTDPELFVLVEAREINGRTAWFWAFARFTHVAATVRHGSQVVFECKHRKESEGLTKYFVLFRAETRPADLNEGEDLEGGS